MALVYLIWGPEYGCTKLNVRIRYKMSLLQNNIEVFLVDKILLILRLSIFSSKRFLIHIVKLF